MGSIGTPMLTVGAEDITGYENFGLRLQTAQWQPDVNEPFRKTGYIVFNTLNDALELYKVDLNGREVDLAGISINAKLMDFIGDIRAHGFFYSNAIDHFGGGIHLYVRPKSGGEVRATQTGTTNTYVPVRALLAYVNGVDINTGTNMYIRPASNGVARVTSTGTTETYRPIEASSFNQRSLEKDKTKIELFTDSALKIIRQTDIYKYQMKSDVEVGQGKDRYGVVIGDGYNTPDEFLSYDRTSVDLYSEASIAIKAIQELDDEQQELKGRIAWLEAENKLLREKIKKLEGMIS